MNQEPGDLGDQLSRLHPGTTLVVPNDLLMTWFPPDPASHMVDEKSINAALAFARRFGCLFHYFPIGGDCEQGDGRFHKMQPTRA